MATVESDMSETDIAIVGGGVVGATIGWGLARSGHDVTLLDEGDIALRASRGNFALIWVQGKGDGLAPYAAWTRNSATSWARFASALEGDTGIGIHHAQPGGFSLCLSEAELRDQADAMARLHNQLTPSDYPYEILGHAATRALLPDIGREVAGSIFCPLDGHVNSLKLFHALHAGFQIHGGRYRPDRRVTRIVPEGDGVRIMGDWGEMRARTIVLAAGLDNARLAPMIGVSCPVTSNRGHVLVTEKTMPFLHHPVVNIRQTDEGGVMIGDSHEAGALDTRTRPHLVADIAARAIKLFPRLGDLNIVRSWAALRVMSPDGFPIYEQSSTVPGAFVVSCHSGITLAANHALVLAPAIAAGRLDERFAPFGTARFDVPAAA
jgi:glycine/D-amino acid oxidase-like deaminating enzyme